ncbi:MAG: hypothetical protein P8N76_26160 [Pirellulaceae bacterium]|nr:hypothetical protein [Pirellulaceae bacterium]
MSSIQFQPYHCPTRLVSRLMLCLGLLVTGLSPVANGQENASVNSSAKETPDAVYVIRFIEVDRENVPAWTKAVEEKQAKFNSSEDASQWGTWKILSGPRTNQFARGFISTRELLSNPIHGSQGLNPNPNDPEAVYWTEHIQPLEAKVGNVQFWRPIQGLAYQGADPSGPTKFMQHRRWRMKPGMYRKLEAHYKKLITAMESTGAPINFSIGRLDDGGDFMIYAETTGFDNLADVPGGNATRAAYEKTHGKGAWKQFLQEHNEVMQENAVVETELWGYEEALSNLRPFK